ncbi:unnamed protein product [Phyllotreta striolata]|uniref:Uncharacterized protein n=1 Tax=Phyllotreta striolata TaxID=444603 RepID=A0A9N9TJR2_PHYSR|nr:unnamed protein product [Phyllotreta striolata]
MNARNTIISSIKMPVELIPVNLKPDHMGAGPAIPLKYNPNYRLDHFYKYKHETISRMPPYHYKWGGMDYKYTPHNDRSVYKKREGYYYIPPTKVSMVDRGRLKEIDDFYTVSQLHRDNYRDDTDTLYPMRYFKRAEYVYQCPPNTTSRYFSYPEYHVKYKHPYVVPLTLGRTVRPTLLPDRALTGVFAPSSTFTWKI